MYTKGYTPFGDVYEREGMRKSGDPNTSVGNTIINGLAHMYCFHKYYCKKMNLNILNVENDPMVMEISLLLLGDDNLGSIPVMFADYV